MEKIKRRDPVQTEIQKVHVISPNDAVGALAYVMDPAQMKRAMQSIIKLDPENGKQRIFYAATKGREPPCSIRMEINVNPSRFPRTFRLS
jgi:hypothetical protein